MRALTGDTVRWTIDAARFDGSPNLVVDRKQSAIRIALEDALFPGTSLPADFVCDLLRSAGEWSMKLSFSFGGEVQATWLNWLEGTCKAQGTFRAARLRPLTDTLLTLAHGARLQFAPDWVFSFVGDTAISLDPLQRTLDAHSWVMRLDHSEPLLEGDRDAPRTSLLFGREDKMWDVRLERAAAEHGWRLAHGSEAEVFDELRLEATSATGRPRHAALLTQAADNEAPLHFFPGGGLMDISREPFHFKLRSARLAFTLSREEPHSVLLADFEPQTTWAHTEHLSLSFDPHEDDPPFELADAHDQAGTPSATPAVSAIQIPSYASTCMRVNFDTAKPLYFSWGVIMRPVERFLGYLHLLPWEHTLEFELNSKDTLTILRPSDMMVLDFHFDGVTLHSGPAPEIRPSQPPPATAPWFRVVFPPQHVQEQAFFHSDDNTPENHGTLEPNEPGPTIISNTPDPNPPVWAFSGESTLAFDMGATFEPIPFHLDHLLDWSKWTARVAEVAKSTATLHTKLPQSLDEIASKTHIELPFRVYLSPDENSGWAHESATPMQRGEGLELWHTRLSSRVKDKDEANWHIDETDDKHRTARAIFTPDKELDSEHLAPLQDPSKPAPLFPVGVRDRQELVHLTSDFSLKNPKGEAWTPDPLQLTHLMLSSQGGYLKGVGAWDPPGLDYTNHSTQMLLEQLNEITTLGRDHYVRVVHKGYLAPFGHRASLVTISERVLSQRAKNGPWFAVLHQRWYISVHNPVRTFPLPQQPNQGRSFPFKRVDVLTTQTSDLDPMTHNDSSNFWPMVNGAAFLFRFHFWSMENNIQAEASLPVVFITADKAQDPTFIPKVAQLYNMGNPTLPTGNTDDSNRNSRDTAVNSRESYLCTPFNDQPISYGPPQKSGDTKFATQYIRWQINPVTDTDTTNLLFQNDLPFFYPVMDCAQVTSAALQRITGKAPPTWVTMFGPYLTSGFDAKANAGEVLLQVDTSQAPSLSFSSSGKTDQAGGFVSPDTLVVGFSRRAGPVGGNAGLASKDVGTNTPHASLSTFSTGKFDPTDFFGALTSSKLLGVVKLGDIIAPLLGGVSSNLGKAPQMIEQALHTVEDTLKTYEGPAVRAIDGFQNLLPDVNVIARHMAPEARIIDSNYSAMLSAQATADASRSLDDDLTAALAHSALISSIAAYIDQLSSLLNDPAALGEEACNEIIESLLQSPELTALQNQLNGAMNEILTALAPARQAIDSAVTGVLNKLVSLLDTALPKDPLQVQLPSGDDISRATLTLRELAPELVALVNAVQPAKDLAVSIDTAKANIKSGNPAGAVQQLPAISQNLLSICQALAPLGLDTSAVGDIKQFIQNAQKAEEDLRTTFFDVKTDAAQLEAAVQELQTAVYHLASLPGNSDGVSTLQNFRQVQRCLDRLKLYFDTFAKFNNVPSPAQTHRLLQQFIRLQRQVLVSIHALETAALTAMANESVAIQAAAIALLKALYGIGSAVAQNQSFTEVIGCFGIMRTGLTLPAAQQQSPLLTIMATPLASASSVNIILQAQFSELVAGINGDMDTISAHTAKAIFDADQTLQTQGASMQNRIDAFNAVLPAQAAARLRVFDGTVRYIGVLTTVVSWQSYVLDAPDLTSVKSLLDALTGADAKALMAYAGLLTTVAGSGNNIYQLIQGQKASAAKPAGILYILFADISAPLGKLQKPPANATLSELIDDSRVMLAQLDLFMAKARDSARHIGANAESLLQARNLIPLLLANFPIPDKVSLSYDWHPEIKSVEPIFVLESGADFVVKASFQTDLLARTPPQTSITATLKQFTINLIGSPSFLLLHVKSLVFTSTNGNKPDCRLTLDHVEFGQAMGFVAELAALLDPKTGPFVEFTGLGLRAGFRFAMPFKSVGAFNIFQLAIEVAVSLSFDGTPLRCQIGISDENHPFLLSSGIYGGGGFLQLQLGLDGVQVLEGALEFGVCAAISIGPVGGYGYVMAGIYFHVGGDQAIVCGFLHAHGHMDIFGIISLDIDLYVTLCYMSNPNRVHGFADFSVSVHILFFSADFHMHAEYDFIGSAGASSNQSNQSAELHHEDPWMLADEQFLPSADERWFTDREWKEYQQVFAVCT